MAFGSRGKNVELGDQDLCNSPIFAVHRFAKTSTDSRKTPFFAVSQSKHKPNHLPAYREITSHLTILDCRVQKNDEINEVK